MLEVVRHLIDEVRLGRFALHTRAGDVFLAERFERLGWKLGDDLWVCPVTALAAAEAFGQRQHVWQFHGALDRRVAGEDLLKQRRTRAGQADDEDRIARRRALALS